jgi:ribosomal-protein-alanine N-acetyltransferase
MLGRRRKIRIETERLILRPPQHGDHRQWADLRSESRAFLTPWEPTWASDHLSRKGFTNRVYWAQRSIANGAALPLFLFVRDEERLVGALTLDNIRRGPAQAGTTGYWGGAGALRLYHAGPEPSGGRVPAGKRCITRIAGELRL